VNLVKKRRHLWMGAHLFTTCIPILQAHYEHCAQTRSSFHRLARQGARTGRQSRTRNNLRSSSRSSGGRASKSARVLGRENCAVTGRRQRRDHPARLVCSVLHRHMTPHLVFSPANAHPTQLIHPSIKSNRRPLLTLPSACRICLANNPR
jgi:hypothetical protein